MMRPRIHFRTDTGNIADTSMIGDSQTWPWPTCPDWSGQAISLHEKTAWLDALVREKHLDDNLLRSLRVAPDGEVLSREHLPSTGLWTAMYLASQSLRYAVTRDEEAPTTAAIKGLHDLTAVTGRPGLYGRAYQRPDFTYTYDAAGSPHWVESTAPGYEGWWYNDDVSKDTMDGIMFGYAMALEFLDDEGALKTVRQDVLGFARPFVEAGLQIIDHTGEVTEHGRLYYSAIDDFPGFNALLSMSWVRTAVDAGDDPYLTHFYRDCLLRLGDWSDCPALDAMDIGSYLDAFDDFLYVYRPECKTSYDNIDMVFQAIFPLLRREHDPGVRKRLLDKLRVGIWEPEKADDSDEPVKAPAVSESTHALYVFMYGALVEPNPDDEVFRTAVNDSVCTLYRLERDRFDKTTIAGSQKAACINRMGDPNADHVIPLEERYYDNYVWRLDPYEIPKDHAGVPGLLHSPEDYLLAYWMGRYFGYVSEEM
ncbi:MAG: hypothetical protein GXP54_07065 [Deltaproteobacteria bacterium]|nr:hypothetical protein [Deltaproteobacteria bacterium]